MTKITGVSLGADPELFVENKTGEIISAEGMIGGTKNEPKYLTTKADGHAIQEDNIMVEFNIPPSATEKDFVGHLDFVEEHLNTLLFLNDGCKLNYSASAEIDPKFLDTPQARMFGCEPDFNVHLKEPNNSPNADTNLRTCGGHIHIGYNNPEIETSENIVYAMDILLGLPSIELDQDNRRKEMYGLAGCFRFKPYGLEYRSLSNFWLISQESKRWAYQQTMKAIELVNSGQIPELIEKYGSDIKKAIDTNNKTLAKTTIGKIEELLTKKKVATCAE
tara:strand:- start:14782 stop:15612 length:831 start_codon:yes stop_codon:yes gene_type:complete